MKEGREHGRARARVYVSASPGASDSSRTPSAKGQLRTGPFGCWPARAESGRPISASCPETVPGRMLRRRPPPILPNLPNPPSPPLSQRRAVRTRRPGSRLCSSSSSGPGLQLSSAVHRSPCHPRAKATAPRATYDVVVDSVVSRVVPYHVLNCVPDLSPNAGSNLSSQ